MIEIICKEDLQGEEEKANESSVCLPKNIRQVGSPRGRHKIYIEDYVYTYLHTMAQKKESCAAVFLGKSQVIKDIRYTFINGAVECGAAVFQWDNICLDDSFWEYIYKEEKQYFPETEIVGWFLGKTGQAMELSSVVESAHRKYFAGRDKILMLMDVLEDEEIFFVYDQGYLQKREGYYIYYEKNLAMQEYMVSKREEEQRLEELAELTAAEEQADPEFVKLHRELEQETFAELHRELEQETFAEPHRESLQDTFVKSDRESKSEVFEKPQGESGSEAFTGTGKAQASQLAADFQSVTGTQTGTHREINQEESADKKEVNQEEFVRRREMKQKKKELEEKQPREKIFAKSNLEEPKTQAEEALESYRNMILERQGKQIERQSRNFLYTASSFFLVVVCVIGITTINNYRKMQEVEDALHIMNNTEVSKGDKQTENKDELVVESIESQVSPLKEDSDKKQNTKEAQDGEQADKSQTEGKTDRSQSEKTTEKTDEAEETSAGQSKEARYYTVQPGDTLDSICLSVYKSRDMLDQIREANGIEDGDKIYTGQKLLLP